MAAFIRTHGRSLDGDTVRTIIVRPVTVDTVSDADVKRLISSSNILTIKPNDVMSPTRNFGKADLY